MERSRSTSSVWKLGITSEVGICDSAEGFCVEAEDEDAELGAVELVDDVEAEEAEDEEFTTVSLDAAEEGRSGNEL